MKEKAVRKHLRAKFDDFVKSIDDEKVRSAVEKNSIITGGAIASLLLGEKVNDYDIYFRNRDTAAQVATYYVAKFKANPPEKMKGSYTLETMRVTIDENISGDERVKIIVQSAGVVSDSTDGEKYQYFEGIADADLQEAAISGYLNDPLDVLEAQEAKKEKEEAKDKGPYFPKFISSNAITLAGHVQLIVRFFGEPDQIHENYDFAHCTNYWTSWDDKLVLRPEALSCLLTKELRYVGSRYPLCSILRMRKFIPRGWTINAGQIVKMAMQLNMLDLTDPVVLEDQLVGVDFAYFSQLITMIADDLTSGKARLSETAVDGAPRLDSIYIMELVDKVF